MAVLRAGKFAVGVSIGLSDQGFIDYDFEFMYDGGLLFPPETKFRKVSDYDISEYLLDFLGSISLVKQTGQSPCWFAADGKVYLQAALFYPAGWKGYIAGLEGQDIDKIPEEKEQELKRLDLEREKNGGILPEDMIELLFSVFDDKVLFGGEDLMSGNGPAVRLLVSRADLRQFGAQLEEEFQRLLKVNALDHPRVWENGELHPGWLKENQA